MAAVCHISLFGREKARPSRAAPPSSSCGRRFALEVHLQSELDQPRIARPFYAAEVGSVRNVAVGLKKLRVIKHIEDFAAELNPIALANLCLLEPTSLVEAPGPQQIVRGAFPTASRQSPCVESAGVETQISRPARIELLERTNQVRFAGSLEIETGEQLIVVLLRNSDRESRLECGDAGKRPAVEQLFLKSLILRDRQLPVVAEDEAVPRVEERRCAPALGVERVEQTLEGRGVIEGFAVGVRHVELQTVGETFLEAPAMRCTPNSISFLAERCC